MYTPCNFVTTPPCITCTTCFRSDVAGLSCPQGGLISRPAPHLPGLPISLVSSVSPPPLATAHVSALLGHFLAPLAAQGALLRQGGSLRYATFHLSAPLQPPPRVHFPAQTPHAHLPVSAPHPRSLLPTHPLLARPRGLRYAPLHFSPPGRP